MQEHLERMIQYVKETHLVESLMHASSLKERVKICEAARATAEFVAFEAHYDEAIDELDIEEESILSDSDFNCTKDNAVAIAVILIITNIDDIDMFDDYDELLCALMKVEGEQEETAKSIANFLRMNLITNNTLEEILEEIF